MPAPTARCSMRRPETRPRLRLLIELAARDLWHDRKVSLCIVASLVAVIAPLLLLFGLKHGVVSQLNDELLSDPRNLEVRMLGNYDLAGGWFERLRAQPGVGFVIPLTRSLNTQADLQRDSQHFVANAEVIPTASGDPLIAALPSPATLEQVLLSASAASRLGVQVGDTLRLLVLRKLDGSNERGELTVTVGGVLENSAFTRPAVLVHLDLLVAMENFRDGYAVPMFGFLTGEVAPVRERYARARIYARGLDDVASIASWLDGERIESSTRAREIESVKAISHVLGLIFAVIAWARGDRLRGLAGRGLSRQYRPQAQGSGAVASAWFSAFGCWRLRDGSGGAAHLFGFCFGLRCLPARQPCIQYGAGRQPGRRRLRLQVGKHSYFAGLRQCIADRHRRGGCRRVSCDPYSTG